MKKLSILAALLLGTSAGFSQISVDPEVGLNFSNLRNQSGDNDAQTLDSKIGLRAGIGVNFNITESLYVRPGVYYNMQGAKDETIGIESKITMHYLEVPVNLGYRFTISENAGNIFAEAGPYIALALAGNVQADVLGVEVKDEIDFGTDTGETDPLDWGFKFALGYETPWGVYLKGGYGLGLGNLSNLDNSTTNNRTWNVALGYRIAL